MAGSTKSHVAEQSRSQHQTYDGNLKVELSPSKDKFAVPSFPVPILPRRRKYFDLLSYGCVTEGEVRQSSAPSSYDAFVVTPPEMPGCETSEAGQTFTESEKRRSWPLPPDTHHSTHQGGTSKMPPTVNPKDLLSVEDIVTRSLPGSVDPSPACTPVTTPQASPLLSRKLLKYFTGDNVMGTDTLSTSHKSSSASVSDANKKWFGVGSAYVESSQSGKERSKMSKPPLGVQNPHLLKKQLEKQLANYPLPNKPEFFHQKEDSLFLQEIPRLKDPPRMRKVGIKKKSLARDKDLNLIAPNTF